MEKKLHVLFLNGWYPSRVMPYNGDFIQRHAEAVALKNKVTSIHVITDNNINKNLEIEKKQINGVTTIIGYVKPTRNKILKAYLFYNAYKQIFRIIKPYQLVHVNRVYPIGLIAMYLKLVKKKPYIISEHWTGYLTNKIGLIEKFISTLITQNSSFICPVSNHLGIMMQKKGLKGTYRTVPNVVNTEIFKPLGTKNKTFTLLHISHMGDKHKNISGQLRVMAKLKKEISNFKFYLIGENSFKYKSIIKKLNIVSNVILINQINHSEIPKYMQKAHLLIQFSNYENLPCVILEAFACGLPVISTNVGGISEHFPDNFGTLISKKEEKELLNSILKFYNTSTTANALSMHKYIESKFSPSVLCNKFTNLYKHALLTINK
ncbi:glycosyltransferase [Aureibaculum marinum]|uniref:Glycosyltransferase n=1 Tax=Aureibaculum marinum TaxID=2487930 RepID=A0A3N4P676_9FLAO|nr:glycosyltransferase [Aureibaculum marinum]RPE00141.1 glycosyltransferase [Aureibaculum marinum]